MQLELTQEELMLIGESLGIANQKLLDLCPRLEKGGKDEIVYPLMIKLRNLSERITVARAECE